MSTKAQSDLLIEVVKNSFASKTMRAVEKEGLQISKVTWEDTGRCKNSCWGPNISDMTLRVGGINLPVIRSPNFEDTTWDVDMDKIRMVVGNASGRDERQTISLTEYLKNFSKYQSQEFPEEVNLHAGERDQKVIMSAQSCYLPIAEGEESKFGVSLFNYQSRKDDPAVLVIVVNASGSSAQTVCDQRSGNLLYFNDKGNKCPFVAERLADDRKKRGVADLDPKQMTLEEESRNCLLIIQVPLKPQKPRSERSFDYGGIVLESACFMKGARSVMPMRSPLMKDDIDHAMIRVGESEGLYPEMPVKMVRDSDYPCRVTLQYYKATSNGVISENSITEVAQQLQEATRFGEGVSSLVVDGDTGRPTEWTGGEKAVPIPDWWREFWELNWRMFVSSPSTTRQQAEEFIFGSGKIGDLNSSNPGEVASHLITLMTEFGQAVSNNFRDAGGSYSSDANKKTKITWMPVGGAI